MESILVLTYKEVRKRLKHGAVVVTFSANTAFVDTLFGGIFCLITRQLPRFRLGGASGVPESAFLTAANAYSAIRDK